jgi:hypothetical protein
MEDILISMKYWLMELIKTPYAGLFLMLIFNTIVINQQEEIKENLISIFRKFFPKQSEAREK